MSKPAISTSMLSKENKNKYQPNEGAIFFFLFPYDETIVSKKSCAKVPGVGGGGRKCGLVFLFFVPSFRRLLLFFLKYLCSTFAMGVTRDTEIGGGAGKVGRGSHCFFFLLTSVWYERPCAAHFTILFFTFYSFSSLRRLSVSYDI